jgi:hypothetical protein
MGSSPPGWWRWAARRGRLGLFAAWALLGLAMGAGLYEAAFATLVRLYGQRRAQPDHRHHADRRLRQHRRLAACRRGWSALRLARRLLRLGRAAPAAGAAAERLAAADRRLPGDRCSGGPHATGVGIGATSRRRTARTARATPGRCWPSCSPPPGSSAPPWRRTCRAAAGPGASLAVAVGVGALVGPAQVAGRLLEFGVLRRLHPLLSARHGHAGASDLGGLAAAGGPVFGRCSRCCTAGNGILTIAKGTLPLALFGPQGYGARQGWLMLPARVAQAVAPFAFGLASTAGAGRQGWATGCGLASVRSSCGSWRSP